MRRLINFNRLVAMYPDAGPDELFDLYATTHGIETRWDDDLPAATRSRWLACVEAATPPEGA